MTIHEKNRLIPISSTFVLEEDVQQLELFSDPPEIAVFRNIQDEEKRIRIPLDKAEYIRSMANQLLQSEFLGYVHPDDRFLCVKVGYGYFVDEMTLQSAMSAARAFQQAKLPIYKHCSTVESKQEKACYPLVDELILRGCLKWHFMLKQLYGWRKRRQKEGDESTVQYATVTWNNLPHCTPYQVKLFAKMAFDNGEINETFLRDMRFWILHETELRERAKTRANSVKQVLTQLKEIVKAIIPEKTSYAKSFDQKNDLSFLQRKQMWHIEYSPSDRKQVAIAYKQALVRRTFKRKGTLYLRMQQLFPSIIKNDTEEKTVA